MSDDLFLFEHYAFDDAKHILHLHYGYEQGPSFEETIVFPPSTYVLSDADKSALDQVFRLIFLLAGVSYYKARAPRQLKCNAFPLDQTTAAFVEKVYRFGLGEFSYKNNLDLRDRVHFIATDQAPPRPHTLSLSSHLLVPIGGGKDSIVSLKSLQQAQQPLTLFGLGGLSGLATPIQATMDLSGLPFLGLKRTLSPQLLELNASGAYNGHVPITAILSALAVACALLQGMNTVVMSNEHSASTPNLRFHDLEVNHQYSKSFAFEQDFSHYLKNYISPQLHYFSFLRPLTETAIAQRFSQHPKYFKVFRSCNTAFRQDVTQRPTQWCGHCPKCRFVFLALAPFIAPTSLTGIFGANLLDDPSQEDGYLELCGLLNFKPFECVGDIEESSLLMQHLFHQDLWKDTKIVQKIGATLQQKNPHYQEAYRQLFVLNPDHAVPETYLSLLHACA